MIVNLARDLARSSAQRTVGRLTMAAAASTVSFATMERPWVPAPGGYVAGTKGVSCVPPGLYDLHAHDSESHGRVFALVNHELGVYYQEAEVPEEFLGKARTAVLIHAANWVEELRGCIAPGLSFGDYVGDFPTKVRDSRKALARIMLDLLPFETGLHKIEIAAA